MLALVTAATAVDLDTDLPLLAAELPEARVVVWDDPQVDWASFDVAVIRSTWDYHERRAEFLAWARRVASVTSLWNPVAVLEWNTDKRYLIELTAAGIPVVPTWFVAPGEPVPAECDRDGDVVVKPTVGANSSGVVRTSHAAAAAEHVGRLHRDGFTAMVQPYLAEIEVRGETGLVYLAGEYSHAFRRNVGLVSHASPGSNASNGSASPRVVSTAERDIGDRVMATLPPTAYARIDLIPADDGPAVLEVELTEPSLFLDCAAGSAARAAAVFRSLAR